MLRLILLATVSALTALGCSSKKAPPAPVYPVTGIVTYKGQPVVGADITFSNDDGEGRSAFGRTDEQGKYQLTTFSANDGAVAGKHVVTIVKTAPPVAAPVQPDVESREYIPPGYGGVESTPAPPKSELPEKYGNQETSGQIAVVNADAPNEIDFKLTD